MSPVPGAHDTDIVWGRTMTGAMMHIYVPGELDGQPVGRSLCSAGVFLAPIDKQLPECLRCLAKHGAQS